MRVIIDRAVPSAIGTEQQGRGREEAVSVAECQRVSEDVSALLEVEDAVDHNYTLEVSSPGLDRLALVAATAALLGALLTRKQ